MDLDRPPRSLLVSERSSFQDQRNRINTQVEQHHLNYKVSVLLPGCGSAPAHLDAAFRSFSSFYLIRNLSIHELMNPDFLQEAVYQGSVYGLSFRTRIDEDNCVALTPKGRLTLSLDKDSFEALGVEGKASRFNHRAKSRFIVSVDLTDSCMAPGGRSYQRLVTGLRSRLQLQTDFLLTHHPGGGASLRAILSRYDWSEHRPKLRLQTLSQLFCPALTTSDLLTSDPHSFLEWLGAVNADISSENSSSSFLSSLSCPEPRSRVSPVLRVSISGLLTPQDIHRLIQTIRSHLEQTHLEQTHLEQTHLEQPHLEQPHLEQSHLEQTHLEQSHLEQTHLEQSHLEQTHLEQSHLESWASVTVHGFVDSPVSWGNNEHGVLRGGDAFYSLTMLHNHTYHLHLATGAQDTCPP